MTRRSRIVAYGSASALLAVGTVCEAVFSGGAAQLAGVALIGVGLVGLVSLAFMEIGLSEDRARERGWRGPYDDLGHEGAHDRSAEERDEPPHRRKSAARRLAGPVPLDRRRGQRRRLR